jgi:hypothetical protein
LRQEVATNFSFTLTDCANFWTKSPEMAVGSHSSRGRASSGSVLFVVGMRFRRLFRTFCPEIPWQEIWFWDRRGLLSKTAPSVAQGCASCPPLGESLYSLLLQGRCTQVGFQVRKAARQDTIVVFKSVPMEPAGALDVSRARIAPQAILAWRKWTNLATRTGVKTCGPEMLEILSGRRWSFSTAISASPLAF